MFTKRDFSRWPSSNSGPVTTLGMIGRPPRFIGPGIMPGSNPGPINPGSRPGYNPGPTLGRRTRYGFAGLGDDTSIDPTYSADSVSGLDLNSDNYSVDASTGSVFYQDANGNWVSDPVTSATVTQIIQSSPDPAAAQQAVQQAADSSWSFSSFADTLKTLVPTLTQFEQQQKLFNVNLDRAKTGKPPINAAAYTPGFNFGLTGDTQKLVEYALIGVGGVMLLNSLMKRRRS